ncbi:MAG: nucleotide pyrophosphohydrolase [Deltaproteobacteria bacterium]|nr:nucleotide pyrophosphohydrolase [Deltaproteobacteria bacterium]
MRAPKTPDATTISGLQAEVQRFCEERAWDQFHGAKDLAIGVVTEAAELLDHFRFLDDAQVAALLADAAKREAVEDELADVLFFVLRFAQRFHVDLAAALGHKMQKNAAKYPVAKAKGKNAKYDEL